MFNVSIVLKDHRYHFTVVRPDGTGMSGVRSSRAEVWEEVEEHMDAFADAQEASIREAIKG